ncbi:aspartate kinase [Rickettsiales endosymbiont of Peranema trichophorum]|uniref:aspartate kinase n=1 Tax=Rickettsiales endosymbiont of Peranema trichophorum TaxID=2486577 RepID=UPI0010231623|nr:aspartate kinase [Rickettsiales endosymbiont of Peranema trichophorum]RZI47664.1 aspartate kinase [Rickettsiales endosymbiont of Peranema trichophorum]
MALIVQKFGGTSVGSIERIKSVTNIVLKELQLGNTVVVVVSAMAKVTDSLVTQARELSSLQTSEAMEEYDTILSSGEQVTSGLLALALQARGVRARSWLGWQIPIVTTNNFGNSKIVSINNEILMKELQDNVVPVIAGFQGAHGERITTLGRGGSDTTATALAIALNADRCDIYTDVPGVYTADPRIVPEAHKLNKIAFEEMLEMASSGAKVLHHRCVEMAMKHNLKIQVLSSFEDTPGTMIVNEEEIMEQYEITGISSVDNTVSITVYALPAIPNVTANLFKPFQEANINIDLVVQNMPRNELVDITFTIAKFDLPKSLELLKSQSINQNSMTIDEDVVKVSIIGIGMRSHAGVAQKMFEILAVEGINILLISTSEINVSVLVRAKYKDAAVQALHTGFVLADGRLSTNN